MTDQERVATAASAALYELLTGGQAAAEADLMPLTDAELERVRQAAELLRLLADLRQQ